MLFARTVLILATTAGFTLPAAAAEPAPKLNPPASAPPAAPAAAKQAPAAAEAPASNFHSFVGNWKGKGELREPGKAPAPLNLSWRCKKAAAGWAVSCDFNARGGQNQIAGTDLLGTEASTKQSRWFTVNSQGRTFEYSVQWSDAKNMKARHAWTQSGKKMEEVVTVSLPDDKSLVYRSVVTADGKETVNFGGTLERATANRGEKGQRVRDPARHPAQQGFTPPSR